MLFTLMLRTSSSQAQSTSATQFAVSYHEIDSNDDKLVEKLSKSWRIIKSWITSNTWKSHRPQVQRNVYQSIYSLLIYKYKELKPTSELWQFGFCAFLARPKSYFNTMFRPIIVKARLIELLIPCHVFLLRNQSPHRVFVYKNACFLFDKFWRYAPKKRLDPRSVKWLRKCLKKYQRSCVSLRPILFSWDHHN